MKLAVAVAVAGSAGIVVYQGYRAWLHAHREFANVPAKFQPPAPIDGHQALRLTTKSGLGIAASFVPPKNGTAVILAHGTDSNRTQLWGDAQVLAGAGFGVLALDWPGHGESEGEIHLGTPEREAFTACVDFLSQRDDVKQLGAYGFSHGGGLLAAFVPDEPRVTLLLTVNGWTDALEQMRYEYRRWGPIRQLPAMRASAQHIEHGNLRGIDVAAKLRGRKTLFIASANDEVVPPAMSAELASAAGSEARFVEGAQHMTFREHLKDWNSVLIGFFSVPAP